MSQHRDPLIAARESSFQILNLAHRCRAATENCAFLRRHSRPAGTVRQDPTGLRIPSPGVRAERAGLLTTPAGRGV